MNAVSEFNALVHSFGQQLVIHLGRPNVESLLIRSYEGSDTADVLIRLVENTWENQLAAMEQIDVVRMMFLGEISFQYRFLSEGEVEPASVPLGSGYRAVVAA